MILALACYGTRGDVEPGVVIGRELMARGHEVRMAVPPDMVGFANAAGLAAVAYGVDTQSWMDMHRNLWTGMSRNLWRIGELTRLRRDLWQQFMQSLDMAGTTLMSLADGCDALLTGRTLEEPAANVAEYYDIPLATVHHSPQRVHGQLFPYLPERLGRSAMTLNYRLYWRGIKQHDDAQRRELGLPEATAPTSHRIADRGSLEIQAYDEVCFPGVANEWAKWNGQRPFVGALTMELPTDADEEVKSWITAGRPPIFFGFGSIPVESADKTIAMIGAVCAELGERAVVCAAGTDIDHILQFEHVKLVGAVNFGAVLPACRAAVQPGGAGTTSAALRAGIPTLILWTAPDQLGWARQVKRLKVGTARRFSATTRETLVKDLRTILATPYVTRTREIATHMAKPAESAAAAVDLFENFARLGRDLRPGIES
ncbi:glycosyl transferase family 1 [Mycolicibacterium acapulense]|nr:glycosyl transferase family 1 [Mycolicibacterium acapulense]